MDVWEGPDYAYYEDLVTAEPVTLTLHYDNTPAPAPPAPATDWRKVLAWSAGVVALFIVLDRSFG